MTSYTDEPVVGHQATILRALATGPKSSRELMEALYGSDPEGGPENAQNTIRQHVYWLKARLRPGWTIEFEPGHYKLVRR